MARRGSKNGRQQDVFWKEIGQGAQSLLTILNAAINIIGGSCMIFNLLVYVGSGQEILRLFTC
jgi:hypothetical protein